MSLADRELYGDFNPFAFVLPYCQSAVLWHNSALDRGHAPTAAGNCPAAAVGPIIEVIGQFHRRVK